ncbi:hypothetical protein DFP72DRAFT_1174066 [Ephemerocybe angulata]|uniref:Uncharacterized protein n=1 Tax=Ephemerocybe angulata TaxID=980116 RepID=A0A8H6HMR1_9AGAR|nr:hypothetical protein DFP72DRAFT_1174066 [Tulosesus angulatus]
MLSKAAAFVTESLFGSPLKRKRGGVEGVPEGDEGSSDEIPTSQPDADASYQEDMLRRANKKPKRVGVQPELPRRVITIGDSGDEDDPIEVDDELEDELYLAASKQQPSKRNQLSHTTSNRLTTSGDNRPRTHSNKPTSLSKEPEALRRPSREQPPSDCELEMASKLRLQSPEIPYQYIASSSKTSKPPSSNSTLRRSSISSTTNPSRKHAHGQDTASASMQQPKPRHHVTSTSTRSSDQQMAIAEENEYGDAGAQNEHEHRSTLGQQQVDHTPLVVSPFAPKPSKGQPVIIIDDDQQDHQPVPPTVNDHPTERRKAHESAKGPQRASASYTVKPFKPPSSTMPATPSSGSHSTRSKAVPPSISDSAPGTSRDDARIESRRENPTSDRRNGLNESAGTANPNSHTELVESSKPQTAASERQTRAQTKQQPPVIDVDSASSAETKPSPNPQPQPTSTDQDLAKKYAELEADFKKWRVAARRRLDDSERRAADVEAQLTLTQALLCTRTEELSVAQAFMVTADRVSVAEVVRAVEELNDLVFQCAVDLADVVLEAKAALRSRKVGGDGDSAVRKKERDDARANVVQKWGEGLVGRLQKNILDTKEGEESTVLFEAMVQNALIGTCTALIKSLCLTNGDVDHHLKGVWGRIRKSYEHSIAKNWLAMTAKHALAPDDGDGDSERLLAGTLRDLMLTVGWLGSATPTSKDRSTELLDVLNGKVKTLFTKALGIREMVMESVLSADVEMFIPMKERAFNEKFMVDSYDEFGARKQVKDEVMKLVCATGLGVRCTTVKEVDGEKKSQIECVLKAKVLLHSTLDSEES